jgi:hypothetical protein
MFVSIKISAIIFSVDFEGSEAPNAFLNDYFSGLKSVLTDAVSLAIKSSLLLGLRLFNKLK